MPVEVSGLLVDAEQTHGNPLLAALAVVFG